MVSSNPSGTLFASLPTFHYDDGNYCWLCGVDLRTLGTEQLAYDHLDKCYTARSLE